MKIVALIARILLGLVFVVFGLNGLKPFLPMPPPPPGPAGQFIGALLASHYYLVIFVVQFLGGLILLTGRYVPLALVLLGPVLVNILCFHIFMLPAGLPMALVVTLLWAIVAWWNRQHFAGIFAAQ
jgi:putative oxidoreductase